MSRTLKSIFLLMFASLLCFGQQGFLGLRAGSSSKSDVEKVLGLPLAQGSETPVEYPPQQGLQKISVRYRPGSLIVDDFELLLEPPVQRSALIQSMGLPDKSDSTQVNADNRLVEYFGARQFLAFTHSASGNDSAIVGVTYYSPDSFPGNATAAPPAAQSVPPSLRSQGAQPSAPSSPAAAPARPARAAVLSTQTDTDFRIRLLSPMNTQTSRKGDKVTAQVVDPDAFSGDILEGTVRNSKSGGKVNGKSVLNFTFETLHHGRLSMAVRANVKQVANSRGQRNVDEEGQIVQKKSNIGKVAAATALGALIGGLAAGGKGAAIGAGVGVAASLILIEMTAQGANVSFAPGSEFIVGIRAAQN